MLALWMHLAVAEPALEPPTDLPIVDVTRTERRIRPVTPWVVAASAGLATVGGATSAALGLMGPPFIAQRWAYTTIPLTALGAGLPVFLGTSGGLATSFGAPVTGYVAGAIPGALLGASIGMVASALQRESFAYGMLSGGAIGLGIGGVIGATVGACLATSADLASRRREMTWMPQLQLHENGLGLQVVGRW